MHAQNSVPLQGFLRQAKVAYSSAVANNDADLIAFDSLAKDMSKTSLNTFHVPEAISVHAVCFRIDHLGRIKCMNIR